MKSTKGKLTGKGWKRLAQSDGQQHQCGGLVVQALVEREAVVADIADLTRDGDALGRITRI